MSASQPELPTWCIEMHVCVGSLLCCAFSAMAKSAGVYIIQLSMAADSCQLPTYFVHSTCQLQLKPAMSAVGCIYR